MKNFSWLIGLRFVEQSAALVGVYFLARGLEVENFGVYGACLSFLALCSVATLPGFNTTVTQCVARGEVGIYRGAVRYALLGSLLGSIACFGGWVYYQESDPGLARALLLGAVLFPASRGLTQWQSVLTGKSEFSTLFWIGSLTALVMYSLYIVGIWVFPNQILVPIAAMLLVQASVNLLMTIGTVRRIGTGEIGPGVISHGFKSSVYLGLNTFANHLDRLLLFFLLSSGTAALFIAAERLAETVKNSAQDFSRILVPRFAVVTQYTRHLDRQLWMVSFLISLLILVFTFSLMPWVLILLFSEKYIEAVPIAQGLLVSVAIGNLSILHFQYINSKLATKSLRDVYTYTSVVRIVCTLILVPLLGIWGAVMSAVIYRIANNVVVHTTLKKRHGLLEEVVNG